MKLRLLHVALLATVSLHASELSHRKAAEDMLNLVSGPNMFKAGANLALGPMLARMRDENVTEKYIAEMRQAFVDWIEKDMLWEEISPPMIDLYMETFSEEELQEIIVFYKTPVGQKTLKTLPQLMAAGGRIGESYAKTKQVALLQRIQPIINRY
jgi:hypothetical protein